MCLDFHPWRSKTGLRYFIPTKVRRSNFIPEYFRDFSWVFVAAADRVESVSVCFYDHGRPDRIPRFFPFRRNVRFGAFENREKRGVRPRSFQNRTSARNLAKDREGPDRRRHRDHGLKRRGRVLMSVRRGWLHRCRTGMNGRHGGVSCSRRIAPFPLNRKERRYGRARGGRFRRRDFGHAGRRSGGGFRLRNVRVNSESADSRSPSFRSSAPRDSRSAPHPGNRPRNIRRHPCRPSGTGVRHARTVRPPRRMTRERHSAFGVREIAVGSSERSHPFVRSFLKNRQSHGKTVIRPFRSVRRSVPNPSRHRFHRSKTHCRESGKSTFGGVRQSSGFGLAAYAASP